MGIEVERQWLCDPEARLPDTVGAFRAGEQTLRRISDTYYDTAARDLAGARASLRVRAQDGATLVTFKQSQSDDADGGLRRRTEIEEPLVGDFEAHPAVAAARDLASAALEVLGTLAQERAVRVYARGGQSVEAVVDALTYPDGSREWRLEAEGDEDAVNDFAEALAEAFGGLRPAATGKAAELMRRL